MMYDVMSDLFHVHLLLIKCLLSIRVCLLQLTGALRNLSDAIDQREQFLSNLIIQRLVKVISDYLTDVEIVFNISRLLR